MTFTIATAACLSDENGARLALCFSAMSIFSLFASFVPPDRHQQK